MLTIERAPGSNPRGTLWRGRWHEGLARESTVRRVSRHGGLTVPSRAFAVLSHATREFSRGDGPPAGPPAICRTLISARDEERSRGPCAALCWRPTRGRPARLRCAGLRLVAPKRCASPFASILVRLNVLKLFYH